MAETYRVRYNGLQTSLGAAITTNVQTSITFASALQSMGANIATLGTDEYIAFAIDDEIVHLTAYTAAATSGTISRGKEGTTAASSHTNGTVLYHSPTVYDVEGYRRLTGTHTSSSLAVNAQQSTTFTLKDAAAFRLYKIETDREARVRLYTTTAKRDADAARPVGTDPTGDHGLILDVVTTTGVLSLELSPVVDAYLPGTAGTVPITVDNLSAGTSTVLVTFTYVRTE